MHSSDQSGNLNMGVCTEKSNIPYHSRENKQPCRLPLQTPTRPKRLATQQGHMERDKITQGSPMAGPVLQGLEQANQEVCVLEKSARSVTGECIKHSMAQTGGICIPTVWTYLPIPAKNPDRALHCGANRSCLENSVMVQQHTSDVLQPSHTSPKLTESSHRPFRKQSPATKGRPTDTSRLNFVRGLLQREGVSSRAAEFIFQQQRSSTQRSYDCAWRR